MNLLLFFSFSAVYSQPSSSGCIIKENIKFIIGSVTSLWTAMSVCRSVCLSVGLSVQKNVPIFKFQICKCRLLFLIKNSTKENVSTTIHEEKKLLYVAREIRVVLKSDYWKENTVLISVSDPDPVRIHFRKRWSGSGLQKKNRDELAYKSTEIIKI